MACDIKTLARDRIRLVSVVQGFELVRIILTLTNVRHKHAGTVGEPDLGHIRILTTVRHKHAGTGHYIWHIHILAIVWNDGWWRSQESGWNAACTAPVSHLFVAL